MSEKAKNKREWIKTAAIIFLSVMLVLTFFSQTIMNYSLPVVTAQYVNNGQISAKVRGTGNVESADLYNVQLPETRDIQSIEVKKGDTVEKDQVIMHLKDKDSDELKTAKKELEELQLAYKKALLDGGISDYVYYDAVAGREDSTDNYRAKIKAARTKVENIEAQILALKNQELTGEYDAASLDLKISNAQTAMNNAQAKMEGTNVTAPSGTYANAAEAKTAMDNAATALAAARTDRDLAQTAMNTFYESIKDDVAKLQAAFAERSSLELNSANPNADFATWLSTNPTPGGVTSSSTADDIQNIIEGINYNGRPADNSDPTNPQPATGYYAKTEAYNSAQTAYEAAYKSYSEAAAAYNSFGSASSSQGAYNSAKSEYDNAKNNYDNLVQMKANAALSGTELKNKIAQLENDKTAAQDDLDQLLKDIPGEIELNSTARALKEKQEELQKLLDNAVGATVKAPVAGKIVDISVVSGGKAEANATIATIQPEDKGFTLKISVSAEQAKKVSIGSPAEIQNAWYYNDITVELKAIQNDPANPGKNKLLVFDVSGDVSDGQSLSVSVGS
ncbi:MAG: HlyD family efflux transporter periplasmic adaptor subunit, partial [Lachnospiraceae bacterium]|nr:HlyD family efflux transporter periplasmic adaptor subunit [Lachnospiraceae bacterium]